MSALFENLPGESIPGVTETVTRIRANLERTFPFLWVRGEISDFSRSAAGHAYFSLKDEQSLLPCVWFAGAQKRGDQKVNQLTGEVYDTPRVNPATILANGMELICAGKISYFALGGKCQMIVEFAELGGEGLLAQAFEALRRKLAEKGLFAAEHKRLLPKFPRNIALVTSLRGAAIQDFLRIGGDRGIPSNIRIFPVPVQGQGAAEKISAALAFINRQNWADVIVLIRGGGSREDLWCFNDEGLTQAVYDSGVPVLTGIGHEIDLSLADLAADKAAATPSHAAQILWPLRRELVQALDATSARLDIVFFRQLEKIALELDKKSALLKAFSPLPRLRVREERLDRLTQALGKAVSARFVGKNAKLDNLVARLNASSPTARLETLSARLEHLRALLEERFRNQLRGMAGRVEKASLSMNGAIRAFLNGRDHALSRLTGIFEALNPENPLKRGYALVFSADSLVRSAKAAQAGEKLRIRFADGEVEAIVKRPLSE